MNWLFQANPKLYDLAAAIREGTDRNWAMNQHRDLVSVDDRVFYWESGQDSRLIAVGRVASPVYVRDDGQFGKYAVDVSYDHYLDPPLTRTEIKTDATLATLARYKPFFWLMGTNHPIKDLEVVQALEQAIASRLVKVSSAGMNSGGTLESQIDLDRAIKNAKYQTARALAESISKMEPTAFEWLVRAVLANLGCADIEVTKPSNDGGVDLRARLVAKGVTNIKTAVQAKRTASVSRPVVQNLRGSLSAHESGLLVTSGHFTDSAEREAQEPTRIPIALIDGTKLVECRRVGSRLRSKPVSVLVRVELHRKGCR